MITRLAPALLAQVLPSPWAPKTWEATPTSTILDHHPETNQAATPKALWTYRRHPTNLSPQQRATGTTKLQPHTMTCPTLPRSPDHQCPGSPPHFYQPIWRPMDISGTSLNPTQRKQDSPGPNLRWPTASTTEETNDAPVLANTLRPAPNTY